MGNDGTVRGPMGIGFSNSGALDGDENGFLGVEMAMPVDRPMAFLSLGSGECGDVFGFVAGGS
jgi:hypothetical protein